MEISCEQTEQQFGSVSQEMDSESSCLPLHQTVSDPAPMSSECQSSDQQGTSSVPSGSESVPPECQSSDQQGTLSVPSGSESASADQETKLQTAEVGLEERLDMEVLESSNVPPLRSLSSELNESLSQHQKPKKKKRRSNFTAERLQLDHGSANGRDLHKRIDMTLPNEERMVLLTKACVQYTLAKMKEDHADMFTDFEQFKLEIEEAIEGGLKDVEMKEAIKSMCTRTGCKPNPANIQIKEDIKRMENLINKCQNEVTAWDNVLADIGVKADEFNNKGKLLSYEDLPSEVKVMIRSNPSRKLDYDTMLRDLNLGLKQTEIIIHDVSQKAGLLQKASDMSQNVIDQHLSRLLGETCKDECTETSPRKLIEKIVS